MLAWLFRRNRGQAPAPRPPKADKAIVHQFVPDEVLYPEGRSPEHHDNGWLEAVPVKQSGTPAPARPATAAASQTRAKTAPAPSGAQAFAPAAPASAPSAQSFSRPANASAQGRPRFPYGWLVVVEGPGTGEWFPLENGLTTIGGGADATVRLSFGDGEVADAQTALAFDNGLQGFVLDPRGGTLRVNGRAQSATVALRDGDVIALGGTALRLVALCSPNFRWPDAARA